MAEATGAREGEDVSWHRFKVILEVTVQDPSHAEDNDGPVDPEVTANLIKEVKKAKPKKGAKEWVVKDVTQA